MCGRARSSTPSATGPTPTACPSTSTARAWQAPSRRRERTSTSSTSPRAPLPSRLLGVQFAAALETGAYWRHARRANELACKLRDGLSAAGFEPYIDTCGNQQFFWTTADEGEAFATNLGCETFVDAGARRVMRFITSWATTEQDVDEAIGYARSLKGR